LPSIFLSLPRRLRDLAVSPIIAAFLNIGDTACIAAPRSG
jgi:hypothetical protein